MQIQNISDTALWVAEYRAREGDRPDAIVRDPFARRLAGERGAELARSLPGSGMEAVMALRTRVIDDLILEAISRERVDAVISLAAGLDSRPFRLELPPDLRWVEVDLPPLLAYKQEKLAGETPRCRYEAVALDLADVEARRALFTRLGAEVKSAFVLTEGLLVYLPAEAVTGLAQDLAAVPAFDFWAADVMGEDALKYMARTYNTALKKGQARMQWALPARGDFFGKLGWHEVSFASFVDLGRQYQREMPFSWLWDVFVWLAPEPKKQELRRMSGIVLLERA
ncbi:MAG: methyltransferase [Cyanobacteria bacterium RYN_339]|nr:methyltransferase [Cyanobacteria bacterium RYN_339]